MAQLTKHTSGPDRAAHRPACIIRYGAVRAAIWCNVVDNGNASRPMYCVTFSRSYKDGQNNWKETSRFGFDDLLVLSKAADEAHTWIARQRHDDAVAV